MTIGAINHGTIQASSSAEPTTLGKIPTHCRARFQLNESTEAVQFRIINGIQPNNFINLSGQAQKIKAY